MRRYSTIHALYMSFFSKEFYRDVGGNWRGISFLYLFLILALSWIPMMFKLQAGLNDFIVDEAPKIIKQVPKIRIIKGEVKTDAEMPYFIRDTDGKPLIAIDTTGSMNSLDGAEYKALLTKTKFIMKKSSIETRTFEISQLDDITIDQGLLYDWADAIRQWAIIFLYPFALLFSYIYRLIQALLYALIGIIFVKSLNAGLKYNALVSLAMVSMTPVIIINAVYNYIDVDIPFWFLICFFISMGYLYFGVKANAVKEAG